MTNPENKPANKGFIRIGGKTQAKEMTSVFRERTVLREGIENFTDEEIKAIQEKIPEAQKKTKDFLIKKPYGEQDAPKSRGAKHGTIF